MVILLVEVAQLAEVDIQHVLVQLIMYGMVVLAYVIVPLSMVVVEPDMVVAVELHVEENIRVVTVLPIIVGMEVLVRMYIVTPVRVGIVHLIVEW